MCQGMLTPYMVIGGVLEVVSVAKCVRECLLPILV